MSTDVHFVGSIGLDSVEEIYRTVGGALKSRLPRCPDGEVGGRRLWITWQWPLLRSSPWLQSADDQLIRGLGVCRLRLRADMDASALEFGELGYAREARSSYADFLAARERGTFAAATRFQVSLPTPYAVIQAFVVAEDIPRVLPAYELAMLREVARISAAIPPQDLAIQWDVCTEMLTYDGRDPHLPKVPQMEAVFAATFSRLTAAVPVDVQLGFHLCYGDLDAEHSVQPQDLGKAVGLAQLLIRSAPRAVDWIHMPVPAARDDAAYYAPLAALKDFPAHLMLGLVHGSDGEEGTLRRMRTASTVVTGFGIATECGIARVRSSESVRRLIQVHAAAAEAFDRPS